MFGFAFICSSVKNSIDNLLLASESNFCYNLVGVISLKIFR